MEQNKQKTALTTIGIDQTTNRLIDKFCKRYDLKKGEVVRLAFGYLDKASINPPTHPNPSNPNCQKSTNGKMI